MTEVKRVMMLSVDKREKSILFKPRETMSFLLTLKLMPIYMNESTIICQTGSPESQYDIPLIKLMHMLVECFP